MSLILLDAVCVIVAVGSFAQRITGMGFALIAAPFLVLLLGPHQGVILSNLASAATSLLVLGRVFRQVEWKKYLWLVLPALVGIVPGALLSVHLDPAWLELCIGSLLVVALVVSIAAQHVSVTSTGVAPPVLAGFFAGLTSAAAGTSGPPISMYAVLTRWPQLAFAATVQPLFLTLGITSMVAKLALDPTRWPDPPLWFWFALLAALVLGTFVGDKMMRWIPVHVARLSMVTIAVLGALVVAIHGLLTLTSTI